MSRACGVNAAGRNERRRQTGATALARALASRGLASLQGPLGGEVRAWQTRVTADLGGDLSEAQATILAHAAAKHAVALVIAGALGRDPGLALRRRRRDVAPLVHAYLAVTRALREDLALLGIKRRARDVQTVEEWVEARAKGSQP